METPRKKVLLAAELHQGDTEVFARECWEQGNDMGHSHWKDLVHRGSVMARRGTVQPSDSWE